MNDTSTVRGPASYFPSIDHWLELVRARSGEKHMDTVNWLKAEHGLGHGHANAIVAYARAE